MELYTIQSQYPPCLAELPNTLNNVYEVDLNTRVINSPKFLSVKKDHQAEVVYFILDRFFDYMDLSTTTCLIQYITPDQKSYTYIVPYYDIYTYQNEGKMVIPWNIEGAVTQVPGIVKYSIRFYKIEGNDQNSRLVYNLNTLPAESEVLYGLDVDPLNKDAVDFETEAYEYLMHQISTLYRKGTYWEIVD